MSYQPRKRKDMPGSKQTAPDLIGNVVKYIVIIVLIMFFVSRARSAYDLGYSIFNPKAVDPVGSGHTVTVTVTSDMSVDDIANLLVQNGLIENATVFKIQLKFSDYDGKLMPGTYELSTEMLPSEIMETMSKGSDESSSSSSQSLTESSEALSGTPEESAEQNN